MLCEGLESGDSDDGDDVAVIEGQIGQGSDPSVRTKLRLINDTSLDGRTRSVRMVKEFETQLGLDLGGNDQLTEAQRALLTFSPWGAQFG